MIFLTDDTMSNTRVAEFPNYDETVKYSLVNCEYDFLKPEKFLIPVESEIEANNVIDIDGLG